MIPAWLQVMFVAALPVIELRGALPVAVSYFHFTPLAALALCVAGSLLPFPFIYFTFEAALRFVQRRSPAVHAWIDRHVHSLKAHHQGSFERFGAFALFLVSALPFPGMGAGSAATLAVLFEIRFAYAFPAMALGTIVAGMIVLAATLGIVKVF